MIDVDQEMSVKRYREAWEYHISQLSLLALQANITWEDFVNIKAQLLEWLDISIDNRKFKE